MNTFQLFSQSAKVLKERGASAFLSKAVRFFRGYRTNDEFDAIHGTDTSAWEPLWKLTIDSPNARFGVRYQPTAERDIEEALALINPSLESTTFIDLGCGKGRALLIAAKLGVPQNRWSRIC